MPVDGGGNITRPASPIPVTGQGADAPQINVPVSDIYSIINLFPFLDGRKSWRGNQNLNGYKFGGAANATAPQEYVTLAQMQEAIAAIVTIPIGTMIHLSGAAVPSGWVIGNGQELLRAAYPAFWAWIQTSGNLAASQAAKTHGQYGPGNESTTFTVPNLYADGGYFIRPITAGRGIGSLQQDDNKSHNHTGFTEWGGIHSHSYITRNPAINNGFGTGSNWWQGEQSAVTSSDGNHRHGLQIDYSGQSEARPKNIAYPVLIKT